MHGGVEKAATFASWHVTHKNIATILTKEQIFFFKIFPAVGEQRERQKKQKDGFKCACAGLLNRSMAILEDSSLQTFQFQHGFTLPQILLGFFFTLENCDQTSSLNPLSPGSPLVSCPNTSGE